jgi:hypothetical protein
VFDDDAVLDAHTVTHDDLAADGQHTIAVVEPNANTFADHLHDLAPGGGASDVDGLSGPPRVEAPRPGVVFARRRVVDGNPRGLVVIRVRSGHRAPGIRTS